MIGKTIGRYQIIDKLGEGGMGTVFKAEDTTLNRMVALKSLSGHLVEDEEAKERFIREAQAASALNHPNITTVHDLLDEGDQHFICMEYVEGKTLRDLVESERVSVNKAVDIILQTAEALEAAHNKGILHRDIKSANIMVTPEDRVKVMDFGLAHLEERSQLTRTGTTMGTLAYSSPEQVSGRKVDARSEIFSLGVVSYELLTGVLPFKGTSEAETVLAIISGEPEPISEHRGEISDNLGAVVSQMLHKDPELRYQSCTELISDLQVIEAGLETSALPTTAALTAARAARRKAIALRVAAGAAVVALAVMAGSLFTDRGPSLVHDKILVAVFENETGDPAHDPVGKIMADYLVRGLQQILFIEVIDPRITLPSLQMDQSGSGYVASARSLAEENEAGTIVSGAYYLLGDSLQFQAQVTETRTGKLLRILDPVSSAVANPLEGAGLLQQRVMASIAALFSEELAPFAQGMSQPTNYQAYQEYVTGVELHAQGEYGTAFGHFSRALALDSTFIPPALYTTVIIKNNPASTARDHAKADSLILILNNSRERLTQLERYVLDYCQAEDKAEFYRTARQAWELAPKSADLAYLAGYWAVCNNHPRVAVQVLTSTDPRSGGSYVYWRFLTSAHHMLGEYDLELEAARRGRQQLPALMSTLYGELQAQAALGQIDEVRQLLNEVPTMPFQANWPPHELLLMTAMELRAHGYHEAYREIVQRTVEWFRTRTTEESAQEDIRYPFAQTLYNAEQWDEAEEIFRSLVEEYPENRHYPYYIGHLGVIAARQGRRNEALRISEQLSAIPDPRGIIWGQHPTIWRARIAAQLGDKERAVPLLSEALAQRARYHTWLHCDIDFESLRNYAPFQELVRPKG